MWLERERSWTRDFRVGIDSNNALQGYWYDWVFARILLREAESTIQVARSL